MFATVVHTKQGALERKEFSAKNLLLRLGRPRAFFFLQTLAQVLQCDRDFSGQRSRGTEDQEQMLAARFNNDVR